MKRKSYDYSRVYSSITREREGGVKGREEPT